MEHLINPRVQGIQISGIRQFFTMVANYPDAISLTIGQPDFMTPEHIKEAGKRAIEENKTIYTPNAGILALREAAAQFMQERYGLRYDPEHEIITTVGASQAIDITLRTILEEGSEVILPGPVYPGYEPIIKLCGAVPVYVDTRDTGFKMRADRIKEKISDRTRCIILPYPSNPTGCILDRQSVEEIAELVREKEIFIVSDEIYSELVYGESGEKHLSIASFSDLREKTIVINGLSKSHAMTGWRVGFTFAPRYLTQHMLKVHQYNVSCASSVSQYASLEALQNGALDAEPMRDAYRSRRDYVYERLVQMGMDIVKPEGAFYLFPSIQKYGLSSWEFAKRLLEQERVAVVPGDAFSHYGEGYVRLSYAYSMDVLEEGCNRLEKFITSL
ncbi:aminotransferase A [Caldalkalibacillus mannanilyticus]|uniref:aminotransferase A n=1 Tax=Caldalkalibacillus mannanilyticus TaxID=1418 RepID=UPI0004683848|nr:aminotransferase A [Caldalkalibacillus mannanilyticus]